MTHRSIKERTDRLISRRQAGAFGSDARIVYYREPPAFRGLPITPMPKHDDVVDLFRRSGALLDGHFRLSSGLHSPGYLQCALVLQHPAHAEMLGRAVAATVADLKPTVVLSPALGGVVIGHEVARALGVRAIFAERHDGALTLRRG